MTNWTHKYVEELKRHAGVGCAKALVVPNFKAQQGEDANAHGTSSEILPTGNVLDLLREL